MPDQITSQVGEVAAVAAPAGDMALSELFPTPDEQSLTTTTSDTHPQVGETTPQTTTAAEDFFLKGSVSVYRDREAAIEGINQKDALIEQLRSQVREATGSDPLSRTSGQTTVGTGTRGTTPPVTQTTAPSTPSTPNYIQNPQKLFDDMVAAAQSPTKWAEVLDTYMEQKMAQRLGPYGEALNTVGQTRAQEKVQQGLGELPPIQNFGEFRNSDNYSRTLDRYPTLKGAIQSAEGNPQLWGQLPEFYHMAHDLYTQSQLPQLLEAAKQAPRATNSTPNRMPMAPGSQAPPTTVLTGSPDLTTSEGRQSYISAFEKSQGINGSL